MAGSIAARAERELRSLVGVSSPSGDVAGAEEALAVATALAPEEASAERYPCSSPDHAPDLVLRLHGTGPAGCCSSATWTRSSRTAPIAR